MTTTRNRVAVLHGVNFDILERRDPEIYGGLSLSELEQQIAGWARELGLEPIFFQTNHEGEFVEYLHRLPDLADASIVNAGAWTHYSRAIADALDVARLPAVEVHLSDVENRDDWRRVSVFDGLVLAKISGKGPDGYREALELLARELGVGGLMRGRGDRLEAAARRARARPDAGHRPDQRPLPDRLHRHQRGLRLRPRRAPLLHRLPLHRARRRRGRGLGADHGRRRLAGRRSPSGCAGKVGFEDDHMAGPHRWTKLKEKLADGVEPVAGRRRGRAAAPGQGRRASWRRSPRPRSWPTRSGAGASSAASPGAAERDVARAAEARIRELGADPSFPAIVAAGPNGALPHAEPGEREIGRGELVVFDMGAKLDGYCSDGTRTFATGEPGEEAPRGLRDRAARPSWPRWRRSRPGVEGRGRRRRRPQGDRRRRPRRALRPRPRPRRRPRGPRGPAPLAALRRRARAGRSRHRRAGRSTCPASSGCGSRTWSSSPRTAAATSAPARRS